MLRRAMVQRETFYFDGGSRPNPGPIELAVVTRGRAHFRDDAGLGDNNQAEWLALLFAAELAGRQGARDVLFIGDSALIVQQASGAWPCRSVQLQPYLAAFTQTRSSFTRVRLRHVPRSRNLAGIALARRGLPGWREDARWSLTP